MKDLEPLSLALVKAERADTNDMSAPMAEKVANDLKRLELRMAAKNYRTGTLAARAQLAAALADERRKQASP